MEGFLPKRAKKKRAHLAVSRPFEGAGGSCCNIAVEIVEQFDQRCRRFLLGAGAPACIRADLRIVMPQQL